MMRIRLASGTVLIFVLFSCLMFAQEKNNPEKKRSRPDQTQKFNLDSPFIMPRIEGPVKLDGLSEEPVWEDIEPLPVVTHRPNFGVNPSEHTEILVAYDDNYLYVAGRFFDREPSKIQAPSRRRDPVNPGNDWFGIIIDTFNDKENALAFLTNACGARWDGAIFNDAQGEDPVNISWNTFWDVAAHQNDKGWFMEMRIPFSSLRFQGRNGRVTMGLICYRKIARKEEWVIFPAVPPNWGLLSFLKPSQGHEVVFEGLFSRKPVYVAPYTLGGFGHVEELNENETAYERTQDREFQSGLDVKYGLTSNLTLDVTLNTDFAQVEADDQQVNLTRFSLFFPEKRLFFQERSSNFDYNFGGSNRLFYSRRIGIHEGKPVRIYGGARLVGRIGPWDLGFLSMQTAVVEELPSENFGVFRMRRQVFNPYSHVGGIVTTRLGMNGAYNVAYGLDGIFRPFGNDYLTLKWAQTFENGQVNNLFSLDPAKLKIEWERRIVKGLGYRMSFSRSGSTFNPGIGFQVRDNYTCFYGRILYGWLPQEKAFLFHHQVFLEGLYLLTNTNGTPESAHISAGYSFETKSGFQGQVASRLHYENVPEAFFLSDTAEVPIGEYTYGGIRGEFQTPRSQLFFARFIFDAGSYYDGGLVSVSMDPRWNVSPSLELGGGYEFNRVAFPKRGQQFTAHIARLRILYMLNTQFSAAAFIQYNSAFDALIANIRIRYNPREGIDLYLVYNESLNTDRFHYDPVVPFSTDRTVLLKYVYTFNFS